MSPYLHVPSPAWLSSPSSGKIFVSLAKRCSTSELFGCSMTTSTFRFPNKQCFDSGSPSPSAAAEVDAEAGAEGVHQLVVSLPTVVSETVATPASRAIVVLIPSHTMFCTTCTRRPDKNQVTCKRLTTARRD